MPIQGVSQDADRYTGTAITATFNQALGLELSSYTFLIDPDADSLVGQMCTKPTVVCLLGPLRLANFETKNISITFTRLLPENPW